MFIILTLIALIISDLVNHNIFKPLFGRSRPCIDLPSVRILAGCTSSFSFPSSHASNIFAMSTVLIYGYRKLSYLLFIIAFSVAYSRVYLGVHYPSDVFVGALLGSLYGIGIIFIKKRFLKDTNMTYD